MNDAPLPDQPIDRRMVVRGTTAQVERPWWKRSSLAAWFFAVSVFDVLISWAASSVAGSDSDAAGNGISRAFQQAFVDAGAYLVGFLVLLFLLIRHRGIRIGLMVLLIPTTLFCLMLVQ
jgi:hypothetical protein